VGNRPRESLGIFLSILNLTDRSTLKEKAMHDLKANYEVKDGVLYVNDEAIPLRKGIVYAALARAGWNGHEGPLPLKLVADMLAMDRRVSLLALAAEVHAA
jgi:hypothetical protein